MRHREFYHLVYYYLEELLRYHYGEYVVVGYISIDPAQLVVGLHFCLNIHYDLAVGFAGLKYFWADGLGVGVMCNRLVIFKLDCQADRIQH